MKDIHNKIIYVGKASNLKNRVSSYFNKSNDNDLKLNLLKENINDFEIYITNTSNEALLLESSLIKIAILFCSSTVKLNNISF